MRTGRLCKALVGTVVTSLAASCSALSSNGASDSIVEPPAGSLGSGGSFGGPSSGSGAPQVAVPGAGGTASLPPEKETVASFELPQAGEHFVYAVNTDSDTVAVIDATKLTIQIVPAGDQPKFLQVLAGSDAAIVLNVGSNDATIIRTDSSGASRTSSVLVKPGSNAIAVAPDGKHAVVYFDSSMPAGSATPGSPQDVTVVTLSPDGDTYNDMSIGYHASRVFFSNDSTRSFVVTDDGVSVLDFVSIDQKAAGKSQQGTEIARTVSLGHAKTDNALDVSVTPDGRYALAREENTSQLELVTLDSGDIRTLDVAAYVASGDVDAGAVRDAGAGDGHDAGLPLDGGRDAAPTKPPVLVPPAPEAPAPITDLDLSASGAFAVAVVRDKSAVVRLPIPQAFDDPTAIVSTIVEGEIVGSVSLTPDESTALLYTTAIDPTLTEIPDTLKRLTILDLKSAAPPRTVQLRKAVQSVVISPDSATALVVSVKVPGDPNDPTIDDTTRADRQDGYSLVQIASSFVKLQVTAVPLGPFALVPDGSHLLLLFNQGSVQEVQNVELDSFQVTPIELGSPPTSVGAVPSSQRAFVGQDHPDGRISFIDYQTNSVQTVTGFELNSRIRQ